VCRSAATCRRCCSCSGYGKTCSPIDAAKKGGVYGEQLVADQQNVKLKLDVLGRHLLDIYLLEAQLVSPDNSSRGLCAHIGNAVEVRSPQLQFALPVDESGKRYGYEEGSAAVTLLGQGVQECHRLNRLAQARLIGQDGGYDQAPTVAEPPAGMDATSCQFPAGIPADPRWPILLAGSQILVVVDCML